MWSEYLQKGYVELKTGFRCTAKMRRNDLINYPIQGSAFHVLLWSLIQIHKYMIENKFESFIVGQVHDSIIFDVEPDEILDLKKIIRQISCIDIRKHWDWIIVPLNIEAEITEINCGWDTKSDTEI